MIDGAAKLGDHCSALGLLHLATLARAAALATSAIVSRPAAV